MRYLGIDLAWGEGSQVKPANRSGVVALESDGRIVRAGWTIGVEETIEWIEANAVADTLLFVDAPLVIDNETGQRLAERQVGQRYGKWWVSANSTNTKSPSTGWGAAAPATGGPRLALRRRARRAAEAWAESKRVLSVHGDRRGSRAALRRQRPAYKRAKKGMKASESCPLRTSGTSACDELIRRLAALADSDVPMDLLSNADTAALVRVRSPAVTAQYKKREDLLDAAICAWSAALWHRFGEQRCQVLGADRDSPSIRPIASIIAPARPEQRGTSPRSAR